MNELQHMIKTHVGVSDEEAVNFNHDFKIQDRIDTQKLLNALNIQT